MVRAQRIRIVIGICVFLLGLAIAVLGPVGLIMGQSSRMAVSDFGEHVGVQIRSMERVSRYVLAIQLCGIGLAVGGFLMTFIQWAVWFVGPRDA